MSGKRQGERRRVQDLQEGRGEADSQGVAWGEMLTAAVQAHQNQVDM